MGSKIDPNMVLNMMNDRRQKRSNDPLVALHYQLSHARQDGNLDALVLSDPSGVVVAGAGAWATCEELAAYAPLFAIDPPPSSRVQELRSQVSCMSWEVNGMQLLLCGRAITGTHEPVRAELEDHAVNLRDASMRLAAEGVTRILTASDSTLS